MQILEKVSKLIPPIFDARKPFALFFSASLLAPFHYVNRNIYQRTTLMSAWVPLSPDGGDYRFFWLRELVELGQPAGLPSQPVAHRL